MSRRVLESYSDRAEAGRTLARALASYAGQTDVAVLALPRGGVPVAFEIARALAAPLDVFLVRKLGTPGQEELAMGAVASGGVRVLNPDVVGYRQIPQEQIERVTEEEMAELERRERLYRQGRPPLMLVGKTVILVDDGLATGATMRAAVAALRRHRPAKVVVAVPVAPRSSSKAVGSIVDEFVCPLVPERFDAVGEWYENFSQTTDAEVRELLRRAPRASSRPVRANSAEK